MFGGTLLVISGPCFNQTDTVALVMSDANSEVNCKWLSEYSVTCIFPPLYRTGREMVQLRVVLRDTEALTFTGIITIGTVSIIYIKEIIPQEYRHMTQLLYCMV
jgi:hypothetical protein